MVCFKTYLELVLTKGGGVYSVVAGLVVMTVVVEVLASH